MQIITPAKRCTKALTLLREARNELALAGARRAADKVRKAIASCGGAIRHAQGIATRLPNHLNDDREIRHDMHGYYICTMDEAAHEDDGNASVGFDGRMHWPTLGEARAAHEASAA